MTTSKLIPAFFHLLFSAALLAATTEIGSAQSLPAALWNPQANASSGSYFLLPSTQNDITLTAKHETIGSSRYENNDLNNSWSELMTEIEHRQEQAGNEDLESELPVLQQESDKPSTDAPSAPAIDGVVQTAAEESEGDALKMSAKWNHGFEVGTNDGKFRFHVGGRFQLDNSIYGVPTHVNNNINAPYGDGIDIRRARFRADGTMYEFIDWAAEFDFVNSARVRNQPASATNPGFFDSATTVPTDMWIQFKNVRRFGQVRIGNQKEAIGFEHLVSSRFLPFLERSFNQDTFYGGVYNGFFPGVQATRNYGCDDIGVIQLGLFKPTNSAFAFNTGDGDYSIVGRITRLLRYEEEGRVVTHVGLSARQASAVSQAGVPGRVQTFRTRDAVRSGLSQDWPVPASINLFGDDMQWVNGEFVMVRGPWTLQSEYLISNYHDARNAFGDPLGNHLTYHGGYVQLLRFLTDDFDHYGKKTGVFERVSPLNNYMQSDCEGSAFGNGAWQVGARYNYLDLNDDGFNGGILHNFTLGLNWFLNPNLKFQWNYMATIRNVDEIPAIAAGSGTIHGLGARMAIDF